MTSTGPATNDAPIYRLPPLRTARIGARQQAWREAGPDGAHRYAPIVLLHGIGSNSKAWAGQFARFAEMRRVLAWNAPGYADSDRLGVARPLPDDYAHAALAWLDHVGVDRFILVGQSLGAIMAAAVAIAAPDRVKALVLTSPAGGYGIAGDQPLTAPLQQRIDDARQLGPTGLAAARADRLLTPAASPQAREIVHEAMGEIVPDGYEEAVGLLAGADLPKMAAPLRVPALVIWGAEDIVTPPARCAAVADAIAGAARIEIAGSGHAVATEAPGAFNSALETALAAADGTE